MSIYRRKFISSDGKRKLSRTYTAEFQHRGQRVRQDGFPDRESARNWYLTESLRLKRAAKGYVKPMMGAQIAPLISQFGDYLRSRGRDEKYCYIAEKRLERLTGECGWITIGHVTRESMEQWQGRGSSMRRKAAKAVKAKTLNQFLATAAQWGDWLAGKMKLLPSNPLVGISPLQSKSNDAYRRAASLAEIESLLSTCPTPRRLYYLFRIYVPLRGKTIAALTWGMLKLDATPPYIELPAAVNKSRRTEKSPLRYDLAQLLRNAKGRSKADAPVFSDPPSLAAFRDDLRAAGVALDDGKGSRRLDYHALRKTLVRLLKTAGVSVDQASLLLHHKSVATTRKHYDDDAVEPILNESMEKLPALGRIRRA